MNFFEKFNIIPNDEKIYERAFMHSSYGLKHDIEYTYERLEFLGDSVLNMIVSEYLYNKYPMYEEGKLTKLRANYVCQAALVYYSKELELDSEIKISVEDNYINDNEILSITADVFESFLGAIFIDQGIEKAREFVAETIFKYIDSEKIFFFDYKSYMKEYGDAKEVTIDYEMIDEYGAPHDKTFRMAILVDGNKLGEGTGKSKKEAEQEAAKKAMDWLNIEY